MAWDEIQIERRVRAAHAAAWEMHDALLSDSKCESLEAPAWELLASVSELGRRANPGLTWPPPPVPMG